MGKSRQHHFWTFLRSGSESEVRISIKILVLKLTNLMTLIVHNCRYILLLIMTCIFECHECEFVQGQLRFTPLMIQTLFLHIQNIRTDTYIFLRRSLDHSEQF